jgi:hypothetical protein
VVSLAASQGGRSGQDATGRTSISKDGKPMAGVVLSPTQTLTLDVEGITKMIVDDVFKPAMAEGIEVIAEAARDNLRAHQSRLTGSALWWTDKAKEAAYQREPLIESIRTSMFVAKGELTGFVYVKSAAAHVAYFVEYGVADDQKQVYGNYTGRGEPPRPFMRSAAETHGQRAVRTMQAGVRNRMQTARVK